MSEQKLAGDERKPADYIVPLSINGLEGRMLRLPAQHDASDSHKNREILFIYGHHSTLERWFGLVDVFTEYGNVTMPDLPGFGGMDSFYKIGLKPNVDNLADYLAAFIKWRYRRKKFVIVGMSFGFVIATRMLQKYPELTNKVEMFVSLVGFSHYDDFVFPPAKIFAFRWATLGLARNPFAWIIRHVFLTGPVLRNVYAHTYSGKHKFEAIDPADFDKMMDIEIGLWQANDVRTHWYTAHQFFVVDNCKVHVDLPVWHVSAENDHYFNNTVVEQHMRVIFTDFTGITIHVPNHAPSVVANAEMAAPFLPEELRAAFKLLK